MKVKCINDKQKYLTYGQICEVINKVNESVLIREDDGDKWWYNIDNFQIIEDNPVEIPKQKDDRVVCIYSSDDDNLTVGDIYRVVNEGKDHFLVVDDEGVRVWVCKSQFKETVTQAPTLLKFKANNLYESITIQKALFDAGYSWSESGDKVRERFYHYIFTNEDKQIWTSDDVGTYDRHKGVPSVVETSFNIVDYVDNVSVEGYSVSRELLMQFLQENGTID